jgi:hypothetical protein
MNVAEIRKLSPLAEVYELSPTSRYLILVKRSEGTPIVNTLAKAIGGLVGGGVIVRVEDPKEGVTAFDLGAAPVVVHT